MGNDEERAVGIPVNDGWHRAVGAVSNRIRPFDGAHHEFGPIGECHLTNWTLRVVRVDERQIVVADQEFVARRHGLGRVDLSLGDKIASN